MDTNMPELSTALSYLIYDLEIPLSVSVDTIKLQEICNIISSKDKKFSIKSLGASSDNQIELDKASVQNINDANSILGNSLMAVSSHSSALSDGIQLKYDLRISQNVMSASYVPPDVHPESQG